MSVENLYEVLAIYTALTTAFVILLGILTLLFFRRDKHFALAICFGEVAAYVAVSQYGQAPLSKAVLSIGGFEAQVDVTRSDAPASFEAVLVIGLAGLISALMMYLRTHDRMRNG